MKKKMFNDKFRLTEAVINGNKTMMREIIECPSTFRGEYVAGFNIHRRVTDKKIVGYPCIYDADEREFEMGEILPKYRIGEVVAVAQSYKDANIRYIPEEDDEFGCYNFPADQTKGWDNKMLVRADLMPHQIQITDVFIQELHDISDEDCLKEGVIKNINKIPTKAPQYIINYYPCEHYKEYAKKVGWGRVYNTPREAFAALIDKVSGKGTWERNPYVFVYEFKLIK